MRTMPSSLPVAVINAQAEVADASENTKPGVNNVGTGQSLSCHQAHRAGYPKTVKSTGTTKGRPGSSCDSAVEGRTARVVDELRSWQT